MPLLSLLWGASGLTAIGRYLALGTAALFAMGLIVNSITAPYKREIAGLQQQAVNLREAAEKLNRQIEEDAKLAESQAESRAAYEAELEKVFHAPQTGNPGCKLTGERLQQLRNLADKAS